MSITVIDVLATGAGVLISVALAYSLQRLVEGFRARRGLTQSMLATNRLEKLYSLLDDIKDLRKSEEAIAQVMKHLDSLRPEEQKRVCEMLESSIPARRAFVSKVLHDSVALKTSSAR